MQFFPLCSRTLLVFLLRHEKGKQKRQKKGIEKSKRKVISRDGRRFSFAKNGLRTLILMMSPADGFPFMFDEIKDFASLFIENGDVNTEIVLQLLFSLLCLFGLTGKNYVKPSGM